MTLTGGYPFEVLDGSRPVSAAATSHELKQPAGKTLQVRAPQYFLNQSVRVGGSVNQPFEFAVPGLGTLDVRSVRAAQDLLAQTRRQRRWMPPVRRRRPGS